MYSDEARAFGWKHATQMQSWLRRQRRHQTAGPTTREQVLDLLVAVDEPWTVAQLMVRTGRSKRAVSKALEELQRAGRVAAERLPAQTPGRGQPPYGYTLRRATTD